jgi:hypothetical protein
MKKEPKSNVIPFRRKEQPDHTALRLLRIADEVDAVIIKHLRAGDIDPKDLAGLMAHRLGTLMRHIDEKSVLWGVCEKVLKRQAAID